MRGSAPTDFHAKQRARRRLYSPLTLGVLALLIVIAAYNVLDMYRKSRDTKAALAKSEAAYNELVEREAFLDEEIGRLSSSEGVEAEIRERFGVAKAGEEVIVVLAEEAPAPPEEVRPGWWQRMKAWLSGANDDYVRE